MTVVLMLVRIFFRHDPEPIIRKLFKSRNIIRIYQHNSDDGHGYYLAKPWSYLFYISINIPGRGLIGTDADNVDLSSQPWRIAMFTGYKI